MVEENEFGYLLNISPTTGQLELGDANLMELFAAITKYCDSIKYATYRTAAKLISLSKGLYSK